MSERWADAVGYGLAVVILVVGGAYIRTPILNWICGPAVVIACVSLVGPRLARKGKEDAGS